MTLGSSRVVSCGGVAVRATVVVAKATLIAHLLMLAPAQVGYLLNLAIIHT
jgi:hypothetical protein